MGNELVVSKDEVRAMCFDVVGASYENVPPTLGYARRCQRLLMATAAAESGLLALRQYGYALYCRGGGYSLWQMERIGVERALRVLRWRPLMAARVGRIIFGSAGANVDWCLDCTPELVCASLVMVGGQAFGCVLARAYYMADSDPIPASLEGMAKYWKRMYNTAAGSGTEAGFLRAVSHVWGSELDT